MPPILIEGISPIPPEITIINETQGGTVIAKDSKGITVFNIRPDETEIIKIDNKEIKFTGT